MSRTGMNDLFHYDLVHGPLEGGNWRYLFLSVRADM
jgi:hypothetical protein